MGNSEQGRPGALSRRAFLKRAGAAAAATAVGLAAPNTARAAALGPRLPAHVASLDDFNWQRFKGETISALLVLGPRADVLTKNQREFEDMTGIRVEADVVPEQQARQKQAIEFTSGNPSFDVTLESWHVSKGLFGKGKWLSTLNDMLNDPAMTAPDYDWNDFLPAGITFATQPDGRIDTLPLNIDYWILYWSKDLFEKRGVQFPNTLDELLEAAKALNDPSNNVYGFVARGLKNANVPVWTGFMQGYGVEAIDSNGNMNTTSDAAVSAAKLYQELLSKYAPPGVSGFNWNEAQTSFTQGNAAMWYDGIGFAPPLEDPTKSRIVGKVGYGLQPAGPVTRHSAMFGDGIGISAASKKQGPAYFYCQWATNKQNQARLLQSGGGSPPRASAYTNPEALSGLKVPREWVETLVESGKIAYPGLPTIIPVTEFRDIFGIALTNMISGADPKSELEAATQQFKPILERSMQS